MSANLSTEKWRRAMKVFEQVLELPSAEQEDFIDSACAEDAALARSVRALLVADQNEESLLAGAAEDISLALEQERDTPWLGRTLGSYRIISKLGHGGMGSVYLAERDDTEFRKKVAIKILSLWLCNPDNLRRFRLERQILAMLEHPNVARLLDGGTTDEGLPYLVMDYVEGVPLTTFCDEQRLTVRQRLELFRQVCDAVSFAHQSLVVHRDLKPHNILVTAGGVPKLLDFGIAKIMEASSFVDSSGLTLTHQRLLTPDYASPEQIAGQPITTATDVYSLGVLLYELLTGVRPFPRQGRSLREIEEDSRNRMPTQPSSAVVQPAADTSPDGQEVAHSRRSKPQSLARQLAGDLDNIVLAALRPEPRERYGSVRELSEDLRRYLDGLPVHARRAGWPYRLGKFVRRHALATASAALVTALILGFSLVTYEQSLRIREERDLARSEQQRAEQISGLLLDAFELADPSQSRGEEITAREILASGARQVSRELADQPELEATMLHTIGKVHVRLGLYEQAQPLLERSLATRSDLFGDDHPAVAESLHQWSELLSEQGELEAAEESIRSALAIRRAIDAQRDTPSVETADSLHLLAEIRRSLGQRSEAVELHEEAVALQRATASSNRPAHAKGLARLAHSLRLHGERDRAEELYLEALAVQQSLDRGVHPLTAQILTQLARLAQSRGDLEAAEASSRRALEMNRQLYGEAHPTIADSLGVLAYIERQRDNPQSAEALYAEALAMQRKLLGDGNPRLAGGMYNLAIVYHRDLGQLDKAEALYRKAVETFRQGFGDEHVNMGFFLLGLGGVLNDRGELREAESRVRRALDLFTRLSRDGASGRNAMMAKSELGGILLAKRRYDEAEDLLVASLQALTEKLGEDHDVTQRTRRRLARLYDATQRRAQAQELLAAAP